MQKGDSISVGLLRLKACARISGSNLVENGKELASNVLIIRFGGPFRDCNLGEDKAAKGGQEMQRDGEGYKYHISFGLNLVLTVKKNK